MSRKKNKRRKRKRPQSAQRPTIPAVVTWPWVRLAKWVGWGVSAIATVLALLVLLPRVTVDVPVLMNPTEPFSAPIVVRNDGFFPITAVSIECVVDEIFIDEGPVALTPLWTGPEVPLIEAGESATLLCDLGSFHANSEVPISEMTFSVRVAYDAASWWPGSSTVDSVFFTLPSFDGRVHFYRQPSTGWRWPPRFRRGVVR